MDNFNLNDLHQRLVLSNTTCDSFDPITGHEKNPHTEYYVVDKVYPFYDRIRLWNTYTNKFEFKQLSMIVKFIRKNFYKVETDETIIEEALRNFIPRPDRPKKNKRKVIL